MAKGFSNLELPSQRIDIEPLHSVPPAAQQSPAIPVLQPPNAWNALRGAAAMAVWSVPAIPPWLDVLCDSLADPSEGAAALRVDAPWWDEPPWRPAARQQSNDPHLALWRAVVDVFREVRVREAWRPLMVLEDIRERALQEGGIRDEVDKLLAETRTILADTRGVDVRRGSRDPIGLALQLVLLRPTPDRFVAWKDELHAMPPVVWWTGAMLAGLLGGYRDLEPRFRGMLSGRRLLALRTWNLDAPTKCRTANWPDTSGVRPEWRIEGGKARLLWHGETWAERTESSRGRWYKADLEHGNIREAAVTLAHRMSPSILRRRVRIADARLSLAGGGVVTVDAQGRQLVVKGEVVLDLPASSSLQDSLDQNAFREWLVKGSITERLPDPPRSLVAPPIGTAEPEATFLVSNPATDEIPGFRAIPNFISEHEEKRLIEVVDGAEWLKELSRRVQHYGWKYDYKGRKVDPSARLGPLPEWAEELAQRLVAHGLVKELPDQVIVNEYVRNQGIAKHVDCIPCFRGPIVTISLCESWQMIFRERGGRKVERVLDRRSAVLFDGEARQKWTHEIPKRLKEPWGPRGRRVSVTFRKVNFGALVETA